MGVSVKMAKWTENYLGKRSIRTKLNNIVSSPRDLLCGVPQGSIIGLILFLCYINDLKLVIKVRKLGIEISLYADDAVIYCGNYESHFVKRRLERALVSVNDWCLSNYININIQKMKYCIYGSRYR